MKIVISLIALTIFLFEFSCYTPKFRKKQDKEDEHTDLFVSFNADKATCFCIDQYYSNDIVKNAFDSIIYHPFTCDTTYEKGLGYVISIYSDSSKQENFTVEQVRLLDIFYNRIDGVFNYNGYLFLLSGNINPDIFRSAGKDTCLIGIKPEFLRQKWFGSPCHYWSYIFDGKVLKPKLEYD